MALEHIKRERGEMLAKHSTHILGNISWVSQNSMMQPLFIYLLNLYNYFSHVSTNCIKIYRLACNLLQKMVMVIKGGRAPLNYVVLKNEDCSWRRKYFI